MLDKFLVPEATKFAEIRWCLSPFSYCASDGLADLFRNMFPDSTIARTFCLQKDKCASFINFGMALHSRSLLVNNVRL